MDVKIPLLKHVFRQILKSGRKLLVSDNNNKLQIACYL